ncbi:MAG TPA: DUF5995 family protein [Polyangiaceae bacterium]
MQATDIDDVLVKLRGVIDTHRGSPLVFFPAVYRATTARVQAGMQKGSFVDGARMGRFVTAFANRYLAALDAVALGDGGPARAWQVAVDAAARPHTMILQHVLVGMNAHINYDLPLAVLAAANGGKLADLEQDFNAINDILAALLDPVQKVIDGFSPLLKILDEVGGRSDEQLVTFSIKTARAEAWHEATRLADESVEQRERSSESLDRRVALLASTILVPDGALGLATSLIARTESTDITAITEAMLAID